MALIREERFEASTGNGVGSTVLNYAEAPQNGPPLVLLHGLTWRWQVFLPLFPELIHRWHVVAPDLRGHGQSSRIEQGYCGEGYTADIVAFLRERVREPAVLFGHSLGGMIATYIAASHPRLVRALVLADTPISLETVAESYYPSLFRGVLALLEGGQRFEYVAKCLGQVRMQLHGREITVGGIPGNDAAFVRFWARSLSQLDQDTIRMSLDGRAGAGWQGRALFPHVKCPTLLLQANPQLGGLMSDEDVACARKSIRDASAVRLETLGHSLYTQDPAPVVRPLLNFLGSL